MGAEEGLILVNQLVFQTTGDYLSDLKQAIFRRAWDGETYGAIAAALDYDDTYIRDQGAALFGLLSNVLGGKVTKSNFRSAVEQYRQSPRIGLPVSDNGAVSLDAELRFVGRERAIADLNQLILQGAPLILIHAEGGTGKTTLARKYFETQGFDRYLAVWMATESQHITPVESVVEEWLRRDFNEEPGRDFGINLERLKRRLRQAPGRTGILIDNLEPALDRHGRFLQAHCRYVDLLRALADLDLRSVTLITSREQLYETSFSLERYPLEGLDEASWRQYFHNRGLDGTTPAIAAMCQAYGGNAKAMKILSGILLQDFDGEIETYWCRNHTDLLLEGELRNLVASQFDRLQQIDPAAYQLLCRLGCYRYQDIPHLPLAGVTDLLWDVPEENRRTIIRSLQDRSLLEVRRLTGKYWLHPVIRAEAVTRLRNSPEWDTIHRQAAQFWSHSVQKVQTIDDALRSLEAYYHYVEISDFERACNVITDIKPNKWEEPLPLGWSFYRLRSFQQIIAPIREILDRLQPCASQGKLYNLLGYIYRLQGRIQAALNCHQQAAKIADSLKMKRLKIPALFNMGLCQRELGNYEIAVSLLDSVLEISAATRDYDEYRVYAQCCLAYVYSCLEKSIEALQLAEQVQQGMDRIAPTCWGKAYSLLFLGSTYRNLGHLNRAFEYYDQTLELAKIHDFTQVHAKAINGMAQLYREQRDFSQALLKHTEAIALLDQIIAKCDLADAYYQQGLTYQRMGEWQHSWRSFQAALHLFTEMEATQQCDRVQQAIAALPHH